MRRLREAEEAQPCRPEKRLPEKPLPEKPLPEKCRLKRKLLRGPHPLTALKP